MCACMYVDMHESVAGCTVGQIWGMPHFSIFAVILLIF